MRILRPLLLAAGLGMSACTSVSLPPPEPQLPPDPVPAAAQREQRPLYRQTGLASWYGRSHHGRTTANGERFDMNALTAAHRNLELGTVVRVTNLATGESVRVRINDRGPYIKGRVLDLSDKAARRLGMHETGIARVRIEVFERDQEVASAAAE